MTKESDRFKLLYNSIYGKQWQIDAVILEMLAIYNKLKSTNKALQNSIYLYKVDINELNDKIKYLENELIEKKIQIQETKGFKNIKREDVI